MAFNLSKKLMIWVMSDVTTPTHPFTILEGVRGVIWDGSVDVDGVDLGILL